MIINDQTSITVNTELARFTRDSKILYVAPDSGSWMVLEGKELDTFKKLTKPITAGNFLGEHYSSNPGAGRDFIKRLYANDLIRLNGRSRYDPSKLWEPPQRYPSFLCLHITEACNLRCSYCYAKAHDKKNKMPLETAKLILERIIRELPGPNFVIDFHGGEPLLEFDNIVASIKHARKVNEEVKKCLSFITQTNGVLITREMALTMKEIGLRPGISIDGPPEVHNKYRKYPNGKGSHKEVWRGIELVRDVGITPGVLAVVHHPEDYVPVLKFFLDNGFEGMRINFTSYIGRAQEEMDFHYVRGENFARNYLKLVDEALAWCRKYDKPLRINDLDHFIHNLTNKTRLMMCYRSPCGIGNSILGFALDGKISGCEETASMGLFFAGSIFDSTPLTDVVDKSPVLQELYQRKVENIPRCSRCAFRRFHGAGCTSKVYSMYKDLFRESPMCRFYQVVMEELMWKIHDNPDMVKYLGYRPPSVPQTTKPPEK
ncbi:MAG: radical SAM protein [Candidatus Eremiobacteraeota bacterium]|nr:radical SAM protein [Candidatus Eremiobacteraeota bacterium]